MSTLPTTRVFQSGNSQAVRIPREFQFDVTEVEIERQGDALVLRPRATNLAAAFDALADMPDDVFAEGRVDTPPQDRAGL